MEPNEKKSSRWAHFAQDRDEATRTVTALLTLIGHVAHSQSGDLDDEERDALSWAAYLAAEMHEDIVAGVPD